jgi:hypothetical protein
MSTQIEDKELTAELQELYLEGKEWISDLDFMETDIDFLKKLYFGLMKNSAAPSADTAMGIGALEQSQRSLKSRIRGYLHTIEPLIINSDTTFQFSLLETFNILQHDLYETSATYKAVKNQVFALTKDVIKDSRVLTNA